MVKFWLRFLQESDHYDAVDETHEIAASCAAHAHLTPDELADEFKRHGLTVHTSVICGCRIAYHYRKPSGENPDVPIEHPIHTHRCERHAHLLTAEEHYAAVIGESRAAYLASLPDFQCIVDRDIPSLLYDALGAELLKEILGEEAEMVEVVTVPAEGHHHA
jgi:hypothetical protein